MIMIDVRNKGGTHMGYYSNSGDLTTDKENAMFFDSIEEAEEKVDGWYLLSFGAFMVYSDYN